MHVLENEYLKVTVANKGAELCSVYDKETETERIWNANPKIWNRHAPILFPFVGRVIDGTYRIANTEYLMSTQHGFARDKEFECIKKTKTSIVHRLTATDDTKVIYPFDFELLVTHFLDDENQRLIHVQWEIKNIGSNVMYYSIGGHPGFMIPEGENKEDYYIEFPKKDRLKYITVSPESGFVEPNIEYELKIENGLIKFDNSIFGTWIFEYQNIEKICITRPDKTPFITMSCEGFPFFAVWAKKTGSFICLEPWFGRSDDDKFTGTLEEKKGMMKLHSGDSNVILHTIEFHK